MESLGNLGILVLVAVALYVITAFVGRGAELLKAVLQKKKAEAEAENKKALALTWEVAIGALDTITRTVVSNLEHTKAYQIRQAVKAGEAAAEELTSLSKEAYEDIVTQLQQPVKEALDSCVADTEKFIREKIEEVLPEIKAKYIQSKEGGADGTEAGC